MIIWGAALGLYSAAMVASFTAIEGSADQLNQLLEAYPKGMLEAFGVTDLGDPANYLHSQVFGLAPLALSFFAILALANALAGAEERGTIDVLLGNPLPRWQLVAGNFLAVAVSLLGICAIVGLLTWGTAALTGVELSLREVAEAVLNLWPICIVFGALALLCSAFFHRRSLAIAIPAFLLFGMYLMDTIGRASEDLEDWRPLLRLLLLRFSHRERHRLDTLWQHNPGGTRTPALGHASLQATRHIYVARSGLIHGASRLVSTLQPKALARQQVSFFHSSLALPRTRNHYPAA